MDDRRSAFPTHETEPETCDTKPNKLDGFQRRTENAPIEFVHKRYMILLVAGVIFVGAFSYFSPVAMMRALHCPKDETAFTYAVFDNANADSSTEVTETAENLLNGSDVSEHFLKKSSLPEESLAVLKSYKTAHMAQTDAVLNTAGFFIYPDETANYVLYVTEDTSYVMALDQNKFRYEVKDDGTFYETLIETLEL